MHGTMPTWHAESLLDPPLLNHGPLPAALRTNSNPLPTRHAHARLQSLTMGWSECSTHWAAAEPDPKYLATIGVGLCGSTHV